MSITEAQWTDWEQLREHPENLRFGISDVDAVITYYRLAPEDEEFSCEDRVAVGVCGVYDHDFPGPRPDDESEYVLLGLNGSCRTRLVNVLLAPDEARQLAKLLKKAAKKVEAASD